MKKLMITIAILAFLAGCNHKEKQNAAANRVKQATIDSMNYANAQQRKIDSLEALTRMAPSNTLLEGPAMIPLGEKGSKKQVAGKKRIQPANPAPAVNVPQSPGSTAPATTTGSAANATVAPANSTVAATPEKKKGLNNAAKGAIIGLGTGAAAGAIIGKENRGKGAVIGGVVGAIGGAVGGAVLDKRKAKKAAERDSLRRDSLRRSQ